MNLTITKQNIVGCIENSVMVTTMEAAFEVLNLTNYPLSPGTIGSSTNRAALLRALDADIKELDTPFLKNVVSQAKILSKQGESLVAIMPKSQMDSLIHFAENDLGLSLCMLRAVRNMIAMGEELGERAFKRERYSEIRYQDFFQKHPITEAKLMDTIRFAFYMAYMEGLEVIKVATDALGGKAPERLGVISGSMNDVLGSGDPRAAMWQPYLRASKTAGKAGLAGIMMPVVDKGIAKFSTIHNAPHNR